MAQDQRQIRWERACVVAQDILEECRVQLMLKFRFLDLALWRMPAEPVDVGARYPLACDAKTVFFEPPRVIARFEESFDESVRDYLHMVAHCIFRHPYDSNHDRHDAWWLACDIVAESVAMEMCATRFASELDDARRAALSELRLLVGSLLPGKLYLLFERALTAPEGEAFRGVTQEKINEWAMLFERDSHEAWPAFAKPDPDQEPGDIQELERPDDSSGQGADEAAERQMTIDNDAVSEAAESQGADDSPADADDGPDASSSPEGPEAETSLESDEQAGEGGRDGEVSDERSQDEREWEEIGKQIEMNLETFSREWGTEAGGLIAALEVANRKTYDYTDFLRRFTTLSEEMKVNDEEYDYIFYTYGLELYGDMPLVEPLEYKDVQRVRDFVIAIDTSESCKGDLVKRFVGHTFTILKQSEGFGAEVNIHVIQCDAKVQADTRLTSLRDVDRFMEGFVVRGFGGTDFRPVFGYVEKLRDSGELADLKGLIYFTDGLGQFPERAPGYDTAFVLMDTGELHSPKVPPWAMKVVLDEEGVNKFRSRLVAAG